MSQQRMAGQALAKDKNNFAQTHEDYNTTDFSGSSQPAKTPSFGKQAQANTTPSWQTDFAGDIGDKYISKGRDSQKIDLVALDQRMHDKADYMRAKGDKTLYNAMGDLWGGVTADWKQPDASADYDINETRNEVNKSTSKTQGFLQNQINDVWEKSKSMT